MREVGQSMLYHIKSGCYSGKCLSCSKIGMRNSGKHCLNISRAKKGVLQPWITGEKNGNWIKDRTLIKGNQNRNNPEYKQWRIKVWKRDNWKCKIPNQDCSGRIEAHHILSWSNYPELRYEINNGITLCQAHHPRKRVDEAMYIPVFQKMVQNILAN